MPSSIIINPSSTTLTASEIAIANELFSKLEKKHGRNRIRQRYYDQKQLLKDLRISLPPQLRNIQSVLGWPAKTVDVLADRIQFQGFQVTGKTPDNYGLDELVEANNFYDEFSQTITSALTHSVAFITISRGMEPNEPEILWLAKSALNATGIWNRRTRSLSSGLTVTGRSKEGVITHATLYLPDKTVDLEIGAGGKCKTDVQPNPTGRVLIEPLIYSADLSREFGRSRISRAVMTLTDSAIRTIVRSEVGAEFFASPQRYILGADENELKDKWDALVSKVLTITRDEDGDLPTIGQFQQLSMQPHTDQLRQWASLLAAETSIPLDELGFPSQNPSSDAAIQSQRDPLRLRADNAIRGFQSTLRRLAKTTILLRDGELPDVDIQGWFKPTLNITDAAAADAVLKQVQVMPWLADSPIILEKLGYDAAAIRSLLNEKRRNEGRNLLERIAANADRYDDDGNLITG